MTFYLFVLILCTAPEFHRIFCENKGVTATEDLLQESLSQSWQQIMECLCTFMELHKHDAVIGTVFGILHLSWNPKLPLDFGDA